MSSSRKAFPFTVAVLIGCKSLRWSGSSSATTPHQLYLLLMTTLGLPVNSWPLRMWMDKVRSHTLLRTMGVSAITRMLVPTHPC